jgi:hypothetical protein
LVQNDGSPRAAGFSLNVIAREPFAAVRRISAAAASGSHSGTIDSGISRLGSAAHHSSSTKSFHACTHASARSRSPPSRNVWPAKRGNCGNASDPNTPSSSMSASRALGSRHPGRMSSNALGSSLNCVGSSPATASRPSGWYRLPAYHQIGMPAS